MAKISLHKCSHDNCAVRNVLARFGDKWSLLILKLLGGSEVMRFNQIYKSIDDISQKMLTTTLRKLEADGLVRRTVFPEVPPRVEYSVTELGASLIPHILNLETWATENMGAILKNREKSQKA